MEMGFLKEFFDKGGFPSGVGRNRCQRGSEGRLHTWSVRAAIHMLCKGRYRRGQ